MRTVLVVSAPNYLVHNQLVYVRLAELGWDVHLVIPNHWMDEYTPGGLTTPAVAGFEGSLARLRVAFPGNRYMQRHFYVTWPGRWLDRYRPDVVFLEHEPFSVVSAQWGLFCQARGIPWGMQADENLDRPFPWPAKVLRRWSLPRADFIAARSPAAGAMMRRWGARNAIGFVSHTLPEWHHEPVAAEREPFTVGFAGRLVEEKGIRDLLAAVARLPFAVRLLVAGDGPLRATVEAAGHEVRTGLRTDDMPALYRQMDVLVLPSRTTRTWAEQFGRAVPEALLCGTPVVGSTCGEIPWVIGTTGGGIVFPEGDVDALAAALTELHADPQRRLELARTGQAGVERHFTPRVAARALNDLMEDALRR